MAKAANPTTASVMTNPAQIERLGGYLHKLRLQKCAERREALLQKARPTDCPTPTSSSRSSARKSPPRRRRTFQRARSGAFAC